MKKQRRFQQLVEIRTRNDLTQANLAEYLSISTAAYCYKENGKSEFTRIELLKLRELFRLNIVDAWNILVADGSYDFADNNESDKLLSGPKR